MNSPHAVVTPERFAEGMTVDQYLTYIGTPENLQREAGWMLGPRRVDFSAVLRERYGGRGSARRRSTRSGGWPRSTMAPRRS